MVKRFARVASAVYSRLTEAEMTAALSGAIWLAARSLSLPSITTLGNPSLPPLESRNMEAMPAFWTTKAIVTGAAAAFAAPTSPAFAKHGARVVVNDLAARWRRRWCSAVMRWQESPVPPAVLRGQPRLSQPTAENVLDAFTCRCGGRQCWHPCVTRPSTRW